MKVYGVLIFLASFVAGTAFADIPVVHGKGGNLHKEISKSKNGGNGGDEGDDSAPAQSPGVISCVVGQGCTFKPVNGQAANKKKSRNAASEKKPAATDDSK